MIEDAELVRRWSVIARMCQSELVAVDPEPGRRIVVGQMVAAPRMGSEDTIESLRAEVARLQGLLEGDPEVLRMQYESGHFEAVLGSHWASRLMAMSFGDSLRGAGAKNFISMELRGLGPDGEDNGEPLRVTIRRLRGDDPEAIAHRFRKVLEEIVKLWDAQSEIGITADLPESMARLARRSLEGK